SHAEQRDDSRRFTRSPRYVYPVACSATAAQRELAAPLSARCALPKPPASSRTRRGTWQATSDYENLSDAWRRGGRVHKRCRAVFQAGASNHAWATNGCFFPDDYFIGKPACPHAKIPPRYQ